MIDSKTVRDVIYLAACAVNKLVPERTRVEDIDLEAVYRLAGRHMITAAVAMALESAGYKDKRSDNAIAVSLRRTAIFEDAFRRVKDGLEAEEIWYMPLKGAVLKYYYPRYGMREFADYDILVDSSCAENVKTIMESIGFATKYFGGSHHDVYYKSPVLNFEMHTSLFNPLHEEALYAYFRQTEDRLLGDGLEKSFTPEDFYLYFLAHEYKHYTSGGTGLRSLLDAYVYFTRMDGNLDWSYLKEELEKLGIAEFEAQNRSLALHLFGEGELTVADEEMLKYILASGTYGTINHRVSNILSKNKWTKLHYMLERFSVPVSKKNCRYLAYEAQYPLFYQHKLMLPFLPFYRTYRSMKGGRFRTEANAIRKAKRKDRIDS